MKKIILDDGEELIIHKRAKTFLLGCCNCKLIHKIMISRKNEEIILKFERWKGK